MNVIFIYSDIFSITFAFIDNSNHQWVEEAADDEDATDDGAKIDGELSKLSWLFS